MRLKSLIPGFIVYEMSRVLGFADVQDSTEEQVLGPFSITILMLKVKCLQPNFYLLDYVGELCR